MWYEREWSLWRGGCRMKYISGDPPRNWAWGIAGYQWALLVRVRGPALWCLCKEWQVVENVFSHLSSFNYHFHSLRPAPKQKATWPSTKGWQSSFRVRYVKGSSPDACPHPSLQGNTGSAPDLPPLELWWADPNPLLVSRWASWAQRPLSTICLAV